MERILTSWIGFTDIRASKGSEKDGFGPICQVIQARKFDEVDLISDLASDETGQYINWLASFTKNKIVLHYEKLTSPTNFSEIYGAASRVLLDIQSRHGKDISLSFHLSPGTPAMAAVWIILAKTRFPAELIESSPQEGVKTASVPFDISAEFIPDLLRGPDNNLKRLANGLPPNAPEFSHLIHRSNVMKRIILKSQRVAYRSVPLLIEGESGTGKELLARAVHNTSTRRKGPFIAVNCGAIPNDLLESELFGYEKGAFTGADKQKTGYFEAANGGTLFLDEIGELSAPGQVKLLRALQENKINRLGSTQTVKFDARIIAATNRDLINEIAENRFREDLFYRIAVAIIKLPPLRERAGDIGLIIDALLKQINVEGENEPGYIHKQISAGAKNLMLQYEWPDPESALVKLRSFIEAMIHRFYDENNLPKPVSDSLFELLNADDFKKAVPPVVLNSFHNIRLAGNKAAHSELSRRFSVMDLLKDAFHLGCWFFIINGGKQGNCPSYVQPEKPITVHKKTEALKEQKRLVQEKLAKKEIEMQSLLHELDTTRSKTYAAQKKIEELEALLHTGKAVADALCFDEDTTRKRLIDAELASAGWEVEANGANTPDVTQEEQILHQPTGTGVGYADYVLWDDNGLPLAVVEAKKTAKKAETGQEQARLYADGLEKMHGQRPIIFYTNGFDIFIWDDAQGYPPRQLYGFYSKDSLQYLMFQRKNKVPLEQFSPKIEIVDRIYQIEAIKRVNEKYSAKRRKALLVQATGTGKTRVAIALTDLLYRANWIMRVLFLCDRRELRKQAKNAFNDFLNEPMTVVTAGTAGDRDKRIYLATYPAMKRIYQTFAHKSKCCSVVQLT